MHSEKWEEIAKENGGHGKIVKKLREIVGPLKNNDYPGWIPFSDELADTFWLFAKHIKPEVINGKLKQWKQNYVAYRPDLIICEGPESLKDLRFVEYVNINAEPSSFRSTFLRCLRGMLALEFTMSWRGIDPKSRRLYIATLDSCKWIWYEYGNLNPQSSVKFMTLTELVECLEKRREWSSLL